MVDFSLLFLCPDLFAQVINKLPKKNYFRLQQTCSAVNEAIHNCQQISVHIEGWYSIGFDEAKHFFQLHLHSAKAGRTFDIETPYGSRLEQLTIPEGVEDYFGQFCDYFKQHRISSQRVLMHRTGLTREQSAVLLRILKPVTVVMNSTESNRLEAVLHSKILKRVEVAVGQDEVAVAAASLISAIPDIQLTVWPIGYEPLSLLRTLLPILRDCSHPKLKQFRFFTIGSWDRPSVDDVKKIFQDMNLIAKTEYKVSAVDAKLDMSQYFPPGSSCHVYLSDQLFKITYRC